MQRLTRGTIISEASMVKTPEYREFLKTKPRKAPGRWSSPMETASCRIIMATPKQKEVATAALLVFFQ